MPASKSTGESTSFAEVMCTEPVLTGWVMNAPVQYTFWFAGGAERPMYLKAYVGRDGNNNEPSLIMGVRR